VEIISENMALLRQDAFRKTGATKADIVKVGELSAAGKTKEQISVLLNLQETVVQAFMPGLEVNPFELEVAPSPPLEPPSEGGLLSKVIKKKKG
jgi:hypothetical protein